MTQERPAGVLDARYSSADVGPVDWSEAQQQVAEAELYWLTTIRPEGGPHVTPLIGVWLEGSFYFCTGPEEQKARNLGGNAHCSVLTGTNTLKGGYDVVLEGDAVQITDDAHLTRIADTYEAKYGAEWVFTVRDGYFHHSGGQAAVYRVSPVTAYGFGKDPYSQTRWNFS